MIMVQEAQQDNKQQLKAAVYTLLISIALFLILMFVYLYRPNPLPSVTYLELEIGGDPDAGGGGGGTGASQTVQPVIENEGESEAITENTKESPEINKPISPVKPVTSNNTNNSNKPNTNNNTKPINNSALFPGMGNEGNGNGDGTGNGDGKGTGNGNGSGNGNGDGNGPGTGPGTKPGMHGTGDYILEGRTAVTKPKITENFNEEGKVVVNVWVDQSGNVTRTSINESQTNTNSTTLRNIALKAAKQWKYNSNNGASIEQKGVVIYKFKLS